MIEEREYSLVRDVGKGDAQAFEQLYETTNKKVFQYLCRFTNDRHLAEDLTMDTYTEVWKSAGRFRGESKVATWMIGIARNMAMNEFRKNGKIKIQELDEDITDPPEQFHACAGKETTQILAEALNRLPISHSEILDLVFLQGMNYEDISRIVDIPLNTVKTRVFYAKEKLRNALRFMGVTKDDLI
jgi:RNA polymerase sigma-70 factor (ECF subfamily)